MLKGVCDVKEIAPTCKETKLHEHLLAHAEATLPSEEELFSLAEFYKIFGDSTRIRLLCVLRDTELCVCDIARMLSMTVSAISHQLRLLKQARLVKFRRAGKTVYYSLADAHIHDILDAGMEHIRE